MFQNIFSFNGRIRRTEYGLTRIIVLTVYFLLIMTMREDEGFEALGLVYIPMLWILLAQGAKRCHDLGKSGWFQIIPFYGLWLLFESGNRYPNEYGYNPKFDPYEEMPYTNNTPPNNQTQEDGQSKINLTKNGPEAGSV